LIATRVLGGLGSELGATRVGARAPSLLVELQLAGPERVEALAALALGIFDA
jgi:hypothetical protein